MGKRKRGRISRCMCLLWWVIIFSLVCSPPLLTGKAWAESHTVAQEEPETSAQAAILMDVESGRTLFEHNSEEPLRIASITKIMTAIVAIEQGDLKDQVEASENAVGVEGSSIYLRPGETLSLEDLLYGLMLRSGNDAAVAIAEHIGGSVEGFVYLMNQKAEELGMEQTVFSNPHGLDTHEEHYSTAKDMAVLTAYALKNETFATIVATKKWTAPLEGEKWDRVWYNKNRLLAKYEYADGVKTGYTKRANRTLVSSATKDGHQLVAVTLNDGDDWNDHMRMFEFGFDQFTMVTLAKKNQKITDERVQREDGYFRLMNHFRYPLRDNESVRKKLVVDAALEEGTSTTVPYPAGYVYYELDGEEIGRTPVEFVQAGKQRRSIFDRLKQVIGVMLGGLYG